MAGILRLLPVKTLLLIANLFDGGAHLGLQGPDDFLGHFLVFSRRPTWLAGANLSGQHDAVCGDQGFAGNPRLRLH